MRWWSPLSLALASAVSFAPPSIAQQATQPGAAGAVPLFDNRGRYHMAIWARVPAAPRAFELGWRLVYGVDPAEGNGPGHDGFNLASDGVTATVNVNGVIHTALLSDIDKIVINGFGGDDTLSVIGAGLPELVFNGAAGTDALNYQAAVGGQAVFRDDRFNDGNQLRRHYAVESLTWMGSNASTRVAPN